MVKIIAFLTCLFVFSPAYADCLGPVVSRCPHIDCPNNTFLGDDGICYPCSTDREVSVDCSHPVHNNCPNRFIEWDCGAVSKLACFGLSESEMKKMEDAQLLLSLLNPFSMFHPVATGNGCEEIDFAFHYCSTPCIVH